MSNLQKFLDLLSKTDGRDKALRLIQYLTLYLSSSAKQKSVALEQIYYQVRATRKVLRFLRTLEFSAKIRQKLTEFKFQKWQDMSSNILIVLQNLFTFLFYFTDHRVFLSQIGVIDKSHHAINYPKSYKYYLLSNIVGALKSILDLYLILTTGKYEGQILDNKKGHSLVQQKFFDLVRYILDVFVSLFFLKNTISASNAGKVGTISSIMVIMQALKLI